MQTRGAKGPEPPLHQPLQTCLCLWYNSIVQLSNLQQAELLTYITANIRHESAAWGHWLGHAGQTSLGKLNSCQL